MDDEDYTIKNEVISGIPTKLCSGETGQESTILQPQTGRRRRKHKSRKICNKTNLEVSATSSGNELSCSIPGFNNTITCDDKEAVSLEHTKSVEDSGLKTNSEINMLDAFVSQSSGDNNNQDINEPSNAQYFDAYDNISPVTEHLVQQQIEDQNCNCNEFSRGRETLCAWCFVTEDGQRCRPANSWNELDAGGIQLETNEISANQEFSYGIEGLSEKSYAIPVVSFGSNEMVETCSAPIDSPIANIIYETKQIEDINDNGICSSNVQQICSPYIEHTTEPFEINTKYNVEDNSGFYEKKCDEPAHMNIMEYADGYYDSSGVYCFASVYESNKEAQDNSTLTSSSHEMTSDFYDAHSSEHFISIPSQTDCVEPLPADLNYRFPSDFEHVSSNLGQHEEIGNSYENYRSGDINNVKIFSGSCCQNNDFINENHLLRGIDELLLNKEECINDMKNMDTSSDGFCPQYSENTHDKVDSNANQANNLSSNNSDDIMDEGFENEDIDDEMENILKKGKDQFQLLTNSSPCDDSTSANTSNSRPSTPNNSVDLKITSDEDKSLSASALGLRVSDDPVFSVSTGTMASDKSKEPTATFIPTDTLLHDINRNHPDKEQNDFINSLKPEETFRSEERTSSFVTPFTINGIQEKMQTGLSDSCDTAKDPNTKSGITLERTANELNEGSNIQAHSATETDSILSVKSVAEIIEFYNKLNDVEPEEISREFNKCVRVREVPASHNLKYENTVFTESGTCLCVQENGLNNEFSTVASQTQIINKVKGIKSESSSFNKNSYSQYSANNSVSNSELHSRDLDCLKREFKINDKENVMYARKFDNPVEVFNSFPFNESSCDCTDTVKNAAKPFSNHYFTNIGSGISNLTSEKSQSETSGEDLNESIPTVKFLETNISCRFSDLAAALNSDSIKYYSKAFINNHFISVDEDYDIDAIQIKQHNNENEMFWGGSSSRVFQRADNSENKVNSDAVLSEKLSLRSVERINDENNFTGSEVSSPRSVSNSIPKVAFEDILYSYCRNIDKKNSEIKNLINTGVSVKQLAKGFDATALTDTPKGFSFAPKTQPGVQNDSSAKGNCITNQEKSEDGGVLSNEDVAQSSEKKPSISNTNICGGCHNSKIDGLIKEFGGKGAFRKKCRNIESEFKTETHRCLCMSKSTNAIVADEKSMRAVNEMSCQTVDCPVDAHLYHYTEKYGKEMDCSSNVSVKDIISFFTNYPDPSKADNFPEEHPTYDVEANCCRTNSFSNLCSACDRKQNRTQAKSSFIADDSKKMATAERKNELVVVLTEPETGGVLESPSDNIFLQDRRAASVPFVMCSRPESLMRLNTGEGGNKFLLVLPDVHKLWMKTLPVGKRTISELTEYIQKSTEDTECASAVSVKDLVSRWNQNSSASQ